MLPSTVACSQLEALALSNPSGSLLRSNVPFIVSMQYSFLLQDREVKFSFWLTSSEVSWFLSHNRTISFVFCCTSNWVR